jgi:cellobiose phosphorylase
MRKFRGSWYHIEVKNPDNVSKGIKSVAVDGRLHQSQLIPVFDDGENHFVEIIMG